MARTNATNRTTSTARVADGYRLNRQEHSPSASFNGSSTGITLGFKANSTGFTIAAWIKVRRFTSGDRIFDQQDSGPSKGFAVLMPVTASDRSLYFSVFGDSSEEANIKIALNIWEWTHIAISFEPNSAKFYKNGVLAGTDTSVSLGDSVTNLVIGKNASSAANYFNGLMKDFVVYDRVLSLAEVENVRDGIVSQTNLKCYLPLSSDLADISVNGNDGTGTAVFTYTNDSPFNDTVGLNMYAPLTSSLLLERGVGYPTWSRATKAWGFNELGYLKELASGCAFFGGARLVQNQINGSSEDFSVAQWTKSNVTISGTNRIICSSGSSLQRMYNSAAGSNIGETYKVVARLGYVNHPFVQINIGSAASGGSCNFNLLTGNAAALGGAVSATMQLVSAGVYDCIATFICTATSAAVNPLILFVESLASTINTSFNGDGIKSFDIFRIQKTNVTNYDASYVPEYVSVGVVPSPFFGAGIDGAKYFETDWQGAPLPAASILGFRREAAATNNLLHGRDLSNAVWQQTGVSGAEILVNGSFVADTDWSKTAGWAIGSGQATCTANGSNQAIWQAAGDSYVSGNKYVLQYTVVSNTLNAGTLRVGGYSGSSGFGVSPTAIPHTVGSQATVITGNPTGAGVTLDLWVNGASSGTLVIDNVSIKLAAVQCSKTATGLDGIANTATTLTASAADAIILQPITLASAARCASAYVKRRTGTGTISFTQDGGSTWTDITSQINSSTWSRVEITATLANPSVGFKISTSGDAIDVDCVQNEAGAVATSPIVTTTATVTRNIDMLSYQSASNIDFTVGTAFAIFGSPVSEYIGYPVSCGNAGRIIYGAIGPDQVRVYDGTTVISKVTTDFINGGFVKAASAWSSGNSTQKLSVDGSAVVSGAFDGSMGSGAVINIASETSTAQPVYVRQVAIYNYQMTDAELQALTT